MYDPEYLDMVAQKAVFLANNTHLMPYLEGMTAATIFDMLLALEDDKKARDKITDALIEYDDSITSIEFMEEAELMDISVSGDNLFFANGILTKNSFGLPMTLDFLFAIVRTEELDKLGQLLCIQLKSRYGDINYKRKFVVGVDIKKFTLFDVEQSAQDDVVQDNPAFDNSKFGGAMKAEKYEFDFD